MSKFKCSCRMLATLSVAAVALGVSSATVRGADATPPALGNAIPPAREKATADKTRLDTFTAADGATYYALSLPAVASPASDSHDMIILYNTSASQVGVYRDKSLEAVSSLLATLGDKDRVQLVAVDLNAIPLTNGFVATRGPAIDAAMSKLRERVPLGATDLGVALSKAIDGFADSNGAAKEVVYIGDGSSKANAMVDEFNGLVDRFVQKHVSVSSYVLGQQVDASILAALANQTGGMLLVDSDRTVDNKQAGMSGKEIGLHLAQLATAPVFWPATLSVSKSLAEVYPKSTPPLRGDRDTILLGKLGEAGPVEVKVSGESAAKPVSFTWSAQPQKSSAENAYLTQLVDAGRSDGGYRLPTVGSEGLWEARRMINLGAQSYARLSSTAIAAGDPKEARMLADEALKRDPTNTRAQLVKDQLDGKVVRTAAVEKGAVEKGAAETGGDVVAQADPKADPNPNKLELLAPTPPAPAGQGQFLDESDKIRQVRIGQIIADVNRQLQQARDTVSTSPAAVKQNLQLLRESVIRAPELPAETRAQLRERIEAVILLATTREREQGNVIVDQQIKAAQMQANLRIQDGLIRNQEKIYQLIERMNSLMQEGKYAEAENDAAIQALNVERDVPSAEAAADPNAMPTVVGAANYARFINNIALGNQIRDATEKQYLATMHLVDESSIPFPDEPPIVYPSADKWRQLTKDREKYKSVDLKEPGSAEARIIKALDEPTEMDFIETPLKDVIEALKIRHGIEIQLDQKALTDAGITADTPITRSLKGISLKSALRLMLSDHEMNFIIDHEVLLITSETKAKEHVVTKVYPVADLVLPIAINSMLNPFQTGGGLGGQSGFNSGQSGGLGQGGFGGGFGGGGGGGFGGQQGGGFGGGGGAFDVADPIVEPKAGTASNAPAAAPQVERKAVAVGAKGKRIDVKADSKDKLDAAWDHYFATLPVPDAEHASAITRERNESVRETVRQLTNDKKFAEVASLIRGALRNGFGQPWMYEALGLAMQMDGQSRDEIERAIMSAVQFASSTNDLMYVAAYLSRTGFDARALKLYRQAAQLDPTRYEPYMLGLTIANRLKDAEGVKWACVGVMGQAWPDDKLNVVQEAKQSAIAMLEQLKKDHKTAEAQRFQAALDEALIRDCVVHVSWTGDAELDLSVEEPAGTVCSYRNPHTTSGGVMLSSSADRSGVMAGESTSEDYVVTRGFSGNYKMLVRRVWGKVSANKVTVDIYSHLGTKKAERIHKQIPIGEKDIVVVFDLKDGRRQEPLAQAQVANALQNVAGMNRGLLAQMAGAQGAPAGVNQQVANALPNRAIVAQQLNVIADPGALQAFAASRADTIPAPVGGVNGNGPNAGLLPFVIQGAVGYQPVITTLPEGTNMSATAVISADRRYVRISVVPLFSSIGDVETFNFATGAQSVTAGGGGGVGGGPGAGGVGGGGAF